MDFKKCLRLKKLVKSTESFGEFVVEAARWPMSYGVPYWSKADYRKFYDSYK